MLACGLLPLLTRMALLLFPLGSAKSPSPPKTFVLGGQGSNEFRLDGQRFRFAAGSMHYWRNKPSEWQPKLQLMRDMGLNAVLTPTNWAWHEPAEGTWDFSGDKDFVKFVRTAGEVGLLVVLRLGSYATAEMDLGGVPYWMLTKNVTTIRSLDPVWQYYEQRYFSQLLPMVVPLQYPNGPVVCVQIGDDSDVSILSPSYYQHQHDEFRKLGYTGLMNTLINPGASGWWGHWSQADKVRINGTSVFAGLEFSSKDALSMGTLNQSFAFTRFRFPTHNPLVDFEYYPGWIDLEGHGHTSVPADQFAQGLDNMFSFEECSGVSIYMACGGTNFGFMGGGEWEGRKSTGIISSYDYAAPITEGGDRGPKFEPVRTVIQKHFPSLGATLPATEVSAGGARTMQGECASQVGHALCGCEDDGNTFTMTCYNNGTIIGVTFASIGSPTGVCGAFHPGSCCGDPAKAKAYITKQCVGKSSCLLDADINTFNGGADPCQGVAKHVNVQVVCSTAAPPAPPPLIPKTGYGAIKFDSVALLFENLGHFNSTALLEPENMEPLGQGYGYILYAANVTLTQEQIANGQAKLTAPGLADRGLVFVGSELQGLIGAWVPSQSVLLNLTAQQQALAADDRTPGEGQLTLLLRILVSNEGRQSGELVSLVKNAKGILGTQPDQPVTVGSYRLGAMHATHLSLPEPASSWLNELEWAQLPATGAGPAGPAFWKATLTATGPQATFLITDGWGHGVVFVNGVNIGKFTCQGPGRSLYVPTGVLHTGTNAIVVFETDQLGMTAGLRAEESRRTMQSVASGPWWAHARATSGMQEW